MKTVSGAMLRALACLVLTVSAVPALAAGASTSDDSISSAIPREDSKDANWYLYAGPGLAVARGNTGWAINFGGLTQAIPRSSLFWGVDLGVDFWSYNSGALPGVTASASATAFQLLPTAIYRFEITGVKEIHPYVGLSFGPNIYIDRSSTSIVGGTPVNTSATTLYLETLFRPGLFLNMGDSLALNVEAKFGLLGTGFAFLPQVNAYFFL